MADDNPTLVVNPHADDIYEALGRVSTARAALAEMDASETTDGIESILDTVVKKLEVIREVVNLTRLCRQGEASRGIDAWLPEHEPRGMQRRSKSD